MNLESHSPAAAHWPQEQYSRVVDPSPDGAHRSVALVIENESGVQGFLIAQVVADEWEIQNIVVAESLRRRGLATRLLSELLNKARTGGAKSAHLEVRESNQAARDLYKNAAFEEIRRRKGYYANPQEDAIVCSLHLL